MLDASPIVQSAISSFNNAALFGPSFFWTTVLMLPLFWLVIKFSDQIPTWVRKNFMLVVGVVILLWLALNPGNYMALRNAGTVLPFGIAFITFCLTAKLSNAMPSPYIFLGNRKYKKLIVLVTLIIGSLAIGLMSGMPTVYGILLQAAAVFCGVLVGRAGFRTINIKWLVFALITMILMQPEFFRFGQLGALTLVHKFFILGMGTLFAAMIALGNINAREKIHNSAYIKIKWAGRIVSALCVILFLLTESVPVFLGMCAVLFVHFAISVWHSKSVPLKLSEKNWAMILCMFGAVTTLPVITAIGILVWIDLPRSDVWRQSKFLL